MKKWTDGTHRALWRACEDPMVREAMNGLEGTQIETALHVCRESESENEGFRRIKHYVLNEAPNETARREADKKDLALRHFTGDELALLRGFAPNSKALLTQMRDGDEAAVVEAKSFIKDLKRVREGLGLS